MSNDEPKVFYGRDFDNWDKARRLQAQLEGRDMSKFSLCLNLGDIPPENVKLSITDRVITVSGYLKEIVEDDDGMIRETFHGFSNEFGLPEGLDPATVRVNDNHDQSITIEADYYVSYDRQEEEIVCPITGRPSSAPSAHSQRDQIISHHDIPLFTSPSNSLPLTPPSSPRRPSLVPSTFNVPPAFAPGPMQSQLPCPIMASQAPPSFNEPINSFNQCQANNLPNTLYTENNLFPQPPQFSTSEMKLLRNTVPPFPENNGGNFPQFNTSYTMRQNLQSSAQSVEDASADMACRFNYSVPPNQARQTPISTTPDRNSVFSQLTPSQLKAFQNAQNAPVESNNGAFHRRNGSASPSQKKTQRSTQPSVVENCYREETAPVIMPTSNYIGKRSSMEIPSNNVHKTLDVPCLANRSYLKPGTRCETYPSGGSSKHDYKIPGTRRPNFSQNRNEAKLESRSQSFHNVSVSKNASTHAYVNKPS